MIEQFKCLGSVSLTFTDLENLIVARGLTDYVSNAIKGIALRTKQPVEERSFEGYALEALVGQQLEDAGVNMKHNTALDDYWYDIEMLDSCKFVDVKKHTTWPEQTKWLSIHKSVLETGGQLRHLRDYGNLKKLYILFMNVTYGNQADPVCKIDPSWVVRADTFFDNLVDSQNPNMKFFDHRNAIKDVDYIRFIF